MQWGCKGNARELMRLFGVSGKAVSAARRIGLARRQRAGLLKGFLMSEARSESGGTPKLLYGELA